MCVCVDDVQEVRELEKQIALLKEKLNSSKQEKEKDIDDVKGEL